MFWLVPSYVCIRLCKHGKHYLCYIFYKTNAKGLPCLHGLMQTLEWLWENSKVCVNPSRTQTFKFSQTPSHVCIRLCKHSKRFIFLKYNITYHTIQNAPFFYPMHIIFSSFFLLNPLIELNFMETGEKTLGQHLLDINARVLWWLNDWPKTSNISSKNYS